MIQNSQYEDIYKDEDCFVCAPGPSFDLIPRELLKGKLTIAINSARFLMEPTYWSMLEAAYVRYLFSTGKTYEKFLKDQKMFMSIATYLIWREQTDSLNVNLGELSTIVRVDVIERLMVPALIDVPSMISVLAQCWWMGCKRVFILGMDLSRPEGKFYAKGAPYSERGATNLFDPQILLCRQTSFPGMKIYNASPHSIHYNLAFEPISTEDVINILKHE